MNRIDPFQVTSAGLDVMMPMNVVADFDGRIVHVGPTLAKVLGNRRYMGERLLDFFDLRRPKEEAILASLRRGASGKVLLRLRDENQTQFIGAAAALPGRAGILVNLSFGISIFEAVKRYGLAGSDFAPTDLTLELLYLAEANSAAMAESRALTEKLQGRVTAAVAEATTDTLTGLHNRRALQKALSRLVDRGIPFTLAHLDLDFFKAVNDTYGHAAGDFVLQEVAKILLEETRSGDTVARIGGDEFVLVFSNLTDRKRLATIAGRIIRRLEQPVLFDGERCRVSGSIGMVSTTQYDLCDIDRMLVDADMALYQSKGLGRARFSFYRVPEDDRDHKARGDDGDRPAP
ncbi:diguanylate cyclase domain-containing protein [Maritimibacter dapengensis]|uniref:Diguanylate cyclase n=1 Tax=Maritimibacter dapengensis TaxID=2836868 RepID=A0ABS6SYP4_9RHOB|nr:diguanylate cyclase [Maritimibacter dapengensis]MBV7378096.1 diguanylate cyclase [Maritimibacter dapengensis]